MSEVRLNTSGNECLDEIPDWKTRYYARKWLEVCELFKDGNTFIADSERIAQLCGMMLQSYIVEKESHDNYH